MKGNSIACSGIYATQNISAGEIIFKLEETAQRIVTRKHVEHNWNAKEKLIFRQYAYPLSKEVFLLWDDNPSNWAPQNHSCDPNTEYEGLNVIASRAIPQGEELTLNYASFLDEHMEPFACQCGAYNCSRWITGIPNNSVTTRAEMVNREL